MGPPSISTRPVDDIIYTAARWTPTRARNAHLARALAYINTITTHTHTRTATTTTTTTRNALESIKRVTSHLRISSAFMRSNVSPRCQSPAALFSTSLRFRSASCVHSTRGIHPGIKLPFSMRPPFFGSICRVIAMAAVRASLIPHCATFTRAN